MQINISQIHESAGLTKVCDFTIESNAVMIRALTSRLYSNPVASILRELASNALDACSTKPMVLHMPSPLAAKFVIRDYGPGLSPSDMVNIFTRFGNSTKRNTNSQIGGFGLGAKSPFAVSNSFTIRSFHNGVCSTYIASIGSDGMPGLHLTDSKHSDGTGLEISVPSTNYNAWQEALSQIQFFEPRPIVVGGELPTPKIVFDHPDFILFERGKPFILVGPVAYPLDHNKISNLYSHSPIALKFPIGTIEVTASREEVVYTPQLIQQIVYRTTQARTTYESHLKGILPTLTSAASVFQHVQSIWFDLTVNFRGHNVNNSHGVALEPGTDSNNRGKSEYWIFDSRERRRVKWRLDHSHEYYAYWKPNDEVYLIDSDDWLRRVQHHHSKAGTHKVICAKDHKPLDLLDIPYIRTSSIDIPKKRRQRILYTYEGNRRVPTTSAILPHYLVVEDSKVTIGDKTFNMCSDLYKEIGGLLGCEFYVISPTSVALAESKGATNILPYIEAEVRKWIALNETRIVGHESYQRYVRYEVGDQCRAALHKLQLLPPAPSGMTVPDVVAAFPKLWSASPVNWSKTMDDLLRKYPMLKCILHSRHDCTAIINLITK